MGKIAVIPLQTCSMHIKLAKSPRLTKGIKVVLIVKILLKRENTRHVDAKFMLTVTYKINDISEILKG